MRIVNVRQALGVLGLRPGSTLQDIRSAHKKAVKELHPDRNPNKNTRELFLQAQNSYEFLISDIEQRKRRTGRVNADFAVNDPPIWDDMKDKNTSYTGSKVRSFIDFVIFTWPLWLGFYFVNRGRKAMFDLEVDSNDAHN